MKVKKITLKNFRNISDATLYPDETLNFLLGANGQGKTSILEALGLVSTLRSFRESKAHAMLKWDAPFGQVSCALVSEDPDLGDWKSELKVSLNRISDEPPKASKVAFIDEKAYRSSLQYLDQRFGTFQLGFHTVIFNPSDHDLVRGDPANRRAYLDRVIAAEDREYLKTFQKYHRVLEQRNAILRSPESSNQSLLKEFTDPLVHLGAYLCFKRLEWIQRVSEPLNAMLQEISPGQPDLRLTYASQWVPETANLSFNNGNLTFAHFSGQGLVPSLKLLEDSFVTRIAELEEAERRQKCSLVGPHRDDWAFYFGGHPLKGHGSQGEVRSALLALKLSEIKLFRDITGHRPLFLLDDFSSELDQTRREFLLKFLIKSDLQSFITTTEDSTSMGKRYRIVDGVVAEPLAVQPSSITGAVQEEKNDQQR